MNMSLRAEGYLKIQHVSLLVNVFFVDNNTTQFSSFITFSIYILIFALLTISTQLSLLFIFPIYLKIERVPVHRVVENPY